jgi:hypothetical protein
MKKFLVIILLMSSGLVAEAKKGGVVPNIDLGVKLGANFAKLDGKSWDNGYKANFLGGVFAGMRFNKVGVQIEGFYSQTNYTVDGYGFYSLYKGFYNNAGDSLKKGSLKVSYFNIPVLFEVKLLPMLWAQIGPQYSGVLHVSDPDNMLQDAGSLFKSGDISGVVGLEAKLPFHLVIGARYVLGLSSMNNTAVSDAWQQRVIQAHVGFSFL